MPQVNGTAPPSSLEPSRAPTSSYPLVPALPAASGSTSSNSRPSTKTPAALRPQRFSSAAQQGPANRIQKSNKTSIKEEPGLRTNYRLPGRLSQATTLGNLNPLPIHRTDTASRPSVSPLPQAPKSIDKTRITIENLTSPSSNVILTLTSPKPAGQMPSEPVKIKKEIKSEPEDEGTTLDKIQPMRTRYEEIWENGTPADRELLHCRWRLQHIAKEAEEHGLSARDALEVKAILDKLSTFPFEGNSFHEVKISTVVKLVAKPDIYGDVIAGRALALRARWKSGDFSPEPFIEEDDELVDSSDYETSDEEGVAPTGPRNHGSTTPFQRERINDCVARLMRGMIVGRGQSGTKTYKMDPRHPKKAADVFGHNGLTVGDWWPFQSFALKDGAHGSKMGGIYGRKNIGAFSVVVSGGLYEDNDFDSGDRILYSGSKGGSNEDPTAQAPYTDVTKSLVISTKHAKPVRVLRSARNNSRWAPTAGIRYDGLYNVESYSIKTDSEGKKFYQFVLVRCNNQPPIDRTRPTAVEIEALERIREM